MKWFKKSITVPSEETVELEGIRTWTVRWISKKGDYPWTTKIPEVQMFTNEKDAKLFSESLKAAFKLIRHTAETEVTIEAQDE